MLPLYDKAFPLPPSFPSLSQTRNPPIDKCFIPVKSILFLDKASEVEVDVTTPCTTMLVGSDGSVARNSGSECNFSDIECDEDSACGIAEGQSFLNANMIGDSLKIRHNPIRMCKNQEDKNSASQLNNQSSYKKNNKSFLSYLRKLFRKDMKGIKTNT